MRLRVGLLWHSLDSGNLGVRALTLAQLALLDEAAEKTGATIEVLLFINPVAQPKEPSPFASDRVRILDTVHLDARNLSIGLARVVRAYRRCDLLIDIAEGDSFTDVYGERRYLKQVASKLLSLAAGRPLVLAPQTIGPFRGRARRALPANILRRADTVFARDGASAAFARELSPGAGVVEATDLAFRLPFRRVRHAQAARTRVGLNVSGLLYHSQAQDGRFGLRASYARLVERLIDTFAARPECELHLIPHVAAGAGRDEDAATCASLAAGREGVILAPPFSDPRDAKSYIAGMDFFVGARMHACIAAFSAGVPLLPLAYTRKATGLFGSLGYPVVGDLLSTDEDELLRLALDTFDRRETLCPALERGNALAAERLRPYEARLADLFRGLSR